MNFVLVVSRAHAGHKPDADVEKGGISKGNEE